MTKELGTDFEALMGVPDELKSVARSLRNNEYEDMMTGGVNGYLATTFFHPTDEFLPWFKNFTNGRAVVEVGCGRGHLMSKMKENGISCFGIDINPPPLMYPETLPIMENDGSEFNYPKGCVVVIARPNRGPWICMLIIQALLTVDSVAYIGKEEHFDDDVYSLQDDYRIEGPSEGGVGAENEKVFVITVKGDEDDDVPDDVGLPMGLPPVDEMEEDVEPLSGEELEKEFGGLIAPKKDCTKGPPCSKCKQVYYSDWYGFRKCDSCRTINIEGFKAGIPFDFSIHKDSKGQYYQVNCKRLSKDNIDEYMIYRPGGSSDRVYCHKVLMQEAGLEYTDEDGYVEYIRFDCDWFDYFEKWVEAYLVSNEGQEQMEESQKQECTGCGAEIARNAPRFNGPGGPKCMACSGYGR